MKIIITEDQYNLLFESKTDKFKKFLKDKFDWFEELKSSISKINNEQKIQNVFICKNNEYDHFII